jgi:hypothetical protein
MKSVLIVGAVMLLLSGCVSTLTPARVREETSAVIGVPADEIAISNQRQEMINTFYTATTRSGERYACTLNGGNIMTLGMTNPATCNKVR